MSGVTAWQSRTAGEDTPAGHAPKATSRTWPEPGLRSSVVCLMLTRLGRHVPRRPGRGRKEAVTELGRAAPRFPAQRPSTSSSPTREGAAWSRASAPAWDVAAVRAHRVRLCRCEPHSCTSRGSLAEAVGDKSCHRTCWDDSQEQGQTGLRRQAGHSSAPRGYAPTPIAGGKRRLVSLRSQAGLGQGPGSGGTAGGGTGDSDRVAAPSATQLSILRPRPGRLAKPRGLLGGLPRLSQPACLRVPAPCCSQPTPGHPSTTLGEPAPPPRTGDITKLRALCEGSSPHPPNPAPYPALSGSLIPVDE